MKYQYIQSKELLLIEYEFLNKMLENKIHIFDRVGLMMIGIIGMLVKLYITENINYTNMLEQIINNFYSSTIIWIFILGLMLTISESYNRRNLNRRKEEVVQQLNIIERNFCEELIINSTFAHRYR